MLSIKQCQDFFIKNTGEKYSEEQIKTIRDYLYFLGEIDYELFKENETKQKSRYIY